MGMRSIESALDRLGIGTPVTWTGSFDAQGVSQLRAILCQHYDIIYRLDTRSGRREHNRETGQRLHLLAKQIIGIAETKTTSRSINKVFPPHQSIFKETQQQKESLVLTANSGFLVPDLFAPREMRDLEIFRSPLAGNNLIARRRRNRVGCAEWLTYREHEKTVTFLEHASQGIPPSNECRDQSEDTASLYAVGLGDTVGLLQVSDSEQEEGQVKEEEERKESNGGLQSAH